VSLINDVATTADTLKSGGVHTRAANAIIEARDGADALAGTADDQVFGTVDEVDAVYGVGPSAIDQLYAMVAGTCEDAPTVASCEDTAHIDFVNDPTTDADHLKAIGVYSRGADNVVAVRNGADGLAGTADDDLFDSLEEIDAVSYIGASSIAALEDYAAGLCVASADVIFSPQYYGDSHLSATADAIDLSKTSLDIAMYSYSDEGMFDVLEDAADRGLSIRVIFHSALEDRKDPEGTRSARIEDMGIEVRYVNKTMHHKYVIIDGPRDSLDGLDTGTLITGSGNWSYSAGTKYDENTSFVQGDDKLILAFQQEFDHMWDNSREVVWNEDIVHIENALEITDEMVADASGTEAVFTSSNMRTYVSSVYGPTFAANTGDHYVADRIVQSIEAAESSILIASGHMRSKQIAEALIAKRTDSPEVDIRVYLDGQEYISEWGQGEQQDDMDDCLADATTETQTNHCLEVGYLWSLDLDQAGIDLKYDYYAYRWNYKYAEQMHHKYLIIDSDEVISGSYNFSSNAEIDSMENTVIYKAADYPELVAGFIDNFETLWVTGEADGLYTELMDEIENGTDDSFSIVWEPMALSWAEVDALKDAVWANCPDLNTDDYRTEPWNHTVCYRESQL